MQNSKDAINRIACTKRLLLRESTVLDLDAFYEIYQSWGSAADISPLSEDRDEEYIKLASYIEWMYGFYGVGLWTVCLKESNQVIGRCGAWPAELGDDWLLELGYIIHKDYCGRGFGLEAMEAVTGYIRHETEFKKAAAKIRKSNRASIRLASKLGMEPDYEALPGEKQMCLYRLDIS